MCLRQAFLACSYKSNVSHRAGYLSCLPYLQDNRWMIIKLHFLLLYLLSQALTLELASFRHYHLPLRLQSTSGAGATHRYFPLWCCGSNPGQLPVLARAL